MKLFDARPSAIRTFGLHIKQFLSASNIELSDILETPSYFILPPWCIKPSKIVLDLVHLKKIKQMHQYTSRFSWKYETGTVITFLFIQMVHGMEMMRLVLVFPSNTLISKRLPDSASVFTALEQIKDSIPSKYIVFTDSLSYLQALHHIKMEHPLIAMVTRKCLFKFKKKRHCFLLGTQP